ncbi:hypothetical protein RFI_08601 [Reticulomyxa filosa]|uniref:Uncharacterized protein n=1 Tax=Reticulomyxa filosa TaxID=46433 RepID=X6NS39_RETFI|nr:hypothetical protein RFI_08601 [Reticulomyxa filosa]|eukprot:ETO28534.1 hypothetical protein RFI_08601 [Reticulomyxa filosa]
MQYVRPASYIRKAVEKWLRETFEIASGSPLRYRVGVHRRAMNEGSKEARSGNPFVCRWQSHGIKGDSRFDWLRQAIRQVSQAITTTNVNNPDDRHYAKLKQMWIDQSAQQNKPKLRNLTVYDLIINVYAHSCAMDWYDLQNILIFHQQSPIRPGEKFFIAHDHQDKKAIAQMKLHGGVEQSLDYLQEWSQANKQLETHMQHCRDYDFCTDKSGLMSTEETIFDMWALFFSEFLVGSWMSTLTRTVCHWKGFEDGMYAGNQCWLQWKWRDTVSHKNNKWFTLANLNWIALADDHKFYFFRDIVQKLFQKKKREKRKEKKNTKVGKTHIKENKKDKKKEEKKTTQNNDKNNLSYLFIVLFI